MKVKASNKNHGELANVDPEIGPAPQINLTKPTPQTNPVKPILPEIHPDIHRFEPKPAIPEIKPHKG